MGTLLMEAAAELRGNAAVGSRVVVALRGRLDYECAPRLKDALVRACGVASQGVVVDLDGLELRDTTPLGVVLGVARRESHRGRTVTVVAAHPRIQALLRSFDSQAPLQFEHGRRAD